MVQRVGPTGFAVVWRDAPSGEGWMEVRDGDRLVARVPAEAEGGQYVAAVTGLQPGHAYTYRVGLRQEGADQLSSGPWTCKTAPGPTASFSFLAFGDSGTGGWGQYRLASRMTDYRFDLVIHTGDLVYKTGAARDYPHKFFRPYAEIIRSVPFMPVIGNHDYETERGKPLLDTFVLPRNGPPEADPERYYWFDFGCARFAAIDTDGEEGTLRRTVVPWLKKVFASARDRWRFVYCHHPPYTCCAKRDAVEGVQRTLAPAAQEARVDVVFSGHDHLYQRSRPMRSGKAVDDDKGTVYIVSGAGGAKRYPAKPPDQRADTFVSAYDEDYSFTLVDVSPEGLTLQQINTDGRVVDRWELKRPPWSSVARDPQTP